MITSISIYDARKLGLKENDPLYLILYMAYICHIELNEQEANRAVEFLDGQSDDDILSAIKNGKGGGDG